jgi:hypothetical protein
MGSCISALPYDILIVVVPFLDYFADKLELNNKINFYIDTDKSTDHQVIVNCRISYHHEFFLLDMEKEKQILANIDNFNNNDLIIIELKWFMDRDTSCNINFSIKYKNNNKIIVNLDQNKDPMSYDERKRMIDVRSKSKPYIPVNENYKSISLTKIVMELQKYFINDLVLMVIKYYS